jgi:multidrug efflux pump subunit AcrB
VIKNDGKRVVKLKDIATIEVKEAIEYIRINANGKEGTAGSCSKTTQHQSCRSFKENGSKN